MRKEKKRKHSNQVLSGTRIIPGEGFTQNDLVTNTHGEKSRHGDDHCKGPEGVTEWRQLERTQWQEDFGKELFEDGWKATCALQSTASHEVKKKTTMPTYSERTPS